MLSFLLFFTGNLLRNNKRCDLIKRNMYGCFNPVIVYGWVEPRDYFVIDQDWFDEQGFDSPWFAKETIKNCAYGTCYGITCRLDESGVIELDQADKTKVENAYYIVKKYYIHENIDLTALAYHQALEGDAEWYDVRYYKPTIDEEDVKVKEEEKEENNANL